MIEKSNSHTKKVGLPPGSLIHIGKYKSNKVKISVLDYNEAIFSEVLCKNADECLQFKNQDTTSWINIDGLHNTDMIASIGKQFNLHPLLLEDVLNTNHRPKMEEFEGQVFLTLKMLGISKKGNTIVSEQISFVLGKDWVISFQEQEGDVFEGLRKRLREKTGNIRQMKADYLLYRLLDTIVDNYFFITEHISESIVKLEEKVLLSPDTEVLHLIQKQKKELINLRKSINPLREAISTLQRSDNEFIKEETKRYFHDVYDHIIQVNDSLETQRDLLTSIMDLYLSGVSNKMNEVMKLLTIIATIFIPLTFIAGIYGMNFDNMPELHSKYGYFIVWGLMIIVAIFMFGFFKRKKWL